MPAILRRYNIYISKTAEFFGLTRTREIYEEAINVLPEARVRPARMSPNNSAVLARPRSCVFGLGQTEH